MTPEERIYINANPTPENLPQRMAFVEEYLAQRQGKPPKNIFDQPQAVVTTSRGLGDTVAKFTHATGLNKIAEAYTHITGKPCGCQQRQEMLNRVFPYGDTHENLTHATKQRQEALNKVPPYGGGHGM